MPQENLKGKLNKQNQFLKMILNVIVIYSHEDLIIHKHKDAIADKCVKEHKHTQNYYNIIMIVMKELKRKHDCKM